MNTDKIKFEMTVSEIRAILEMLLAFDPTSIKKETGWMAIYIARKVYNKLFAKLDHDPRKKVKFSLHIAEAIAVVTILLALNDQDIFRQNVIDQLYLTTHQKLA